LQHVGAYTEGLLGTGVRGGLLEQRGVLDDTLDGFLSGTEGVLDELLRVIGVGVRKAASQACL